MGVGRPTNGIQGIHRRLLTTLPPTDSNKKKKMEEEVICQDRLTCRHSFQDKGDTILEKIRKA
jgi:hypothetical protein